MNEFYDVSIPYDVNDPATEIVDKLVFCASKQAAFLEVAQLMADSPRANCDTAEQKAAFIKKLLKTIHVDRAVSPHANQVGYLLAGLFGITAQVSLVVLGEVLNANIGKCRTDVARYRPDEYYGRPDVFPDDASFMSRADREDLVPDDVLTDFPIEKFPHFFASELSELFNIVGPLNLTAVGKVLHQHIEMFSIERPLEGFLH